VCACLGDCGAEANGFEMECQGIGGKAASLFELTLNQSKVGADFYDLSNVDGYNIPLRGKPYGNWAWVPNVNPNPIPNYSSYQPYP